MQIRNARLSATTDQGRCSPETHGRVGRCQGEHFLEAREGLHSTIPGRFLSSATRANSMDGVCRYAQRPLAFLGRYVRQRPLRPAAILVAVLGAVGCSVSAQYGVKFLVDTLAGARAADGAWLAFALLVSLILADKLLWRLARWVASGTLVAGNPDVGPRLFWPLSPAAPRVFSAPPPRDPPRPTP